MKHLKTLKNTWHFKASDRVKNGIPDIIACVDGYFVALELKRGKAFKATPLQEHTLKQIREAEGLGIVVYPENWDETFEGLKILAGGIKGGK